MQQTLDVPPMFYPLCHECMGLAGLQNSAPCYNVLPKPTAESNFQGATRSQQNECVPLKMLMMNQYLPPRESNGSHTAFLQTDSIVVAPSVQVVCDKAACRYLSLPATRADVCWQEWHQVERG